MSPARAYRCGLSSCIGSSHSAVGRKKVRLGSQNTTKENFDEKQKKLADRSDAMATLDKGVCKLPIKLYF